MIHLPCIALAIVAAISICPAVDAAADGAATGQHFLKLMLAIPGAAPVEIHREPVDGYARKIILHLQSKHGRYRFGYSLDGGKTSVDLAETSAIHVLSRGYTGA